MKKALKAVIPAALLCAGGAKIISDSKKHSLPLKEEAERDAFKVLGGTLNGVLSAVCAILPDGEDFIKEENFTLHDFYKGTGYLASPVKGARWSIGSAWKSLVPEDIFDRRYYLGGYLMPDNGFCNKVEQIIDDMRVRAIAVDDGSGRGLCIFATVDCIGMTNCDIKAVRRKFSKAYSELHPGAEIAAVTVCSTHTHSCIDTQGLWTDTRDKIKNNFKKSIKGEKNLERGADEKYTEFLTDTIAAAMLEAVSGMKKGTMTYAVRDVGSEYFGNKNRPSATALETKIHRLIFTPDSKKARPLAIVNMQAHPDVAGMPTSDGQGNGREISGDYIYYMQEVFNQAGYDFMFFNGAICGIYMSRGASNDGVELDKRYKQSIRYGREIARMTLAMTKTVEEIEADEFLADKENVDRDRKESEENGSRYTLWYENWESVPEVKVPPLLNVLFTPVKIKVTNKIIELAGKLRLANYEVISGKDGYSIVTETGYISFGEIFRAAAVPGEFCQDLLVGGASLKEAHSFRSRPFERKTAREIFGGEIAAIGLCNDAIGYIVPDNDFIFGDFKNHYHETISVGEDAAPAIMEALELLQVKYMP